ncbi:MAG: MFS transporter, partial [Asgard group archaeon]|nr:MFS transporter [Asgard group archaeon]
MCYFMAESNIQLSETNRVSKEVSEVIDDSKRRFRHFLYFFSGQQVSLLGSSIVSFAIIWWLTITTQSEMMLGIASLVSLGPFVLAAPIGGVLADRFDRKKLLIIIDAFQAVFTITLSILFLTNHNTVAAVLVMLGLRGTAQAFHTPISMSIAPAMVPQKNLSRINGLSYLFNGLIYIIGPVIGASLLAIPGVNIGMILWADVITFVIALIPLLIVTIPKVEQPEVKEEEVVKQSFVGQFMEGFNALKATKGMLALLFGAMAINFLMSPLGALMPLFVNKVHGGTEVSYAIVIGMFQAAIVVGGLLMSLFRGFSKPMIFLLITLLFQVLCQIAIVFIPTTFNGRFWAIGGVLFLFALPFAVIDVSFITSIQLLVPKEKLGRVIATIMMISPAMRPLGQFLSGVIAEFVGINAVLIGSGILTVVVFGLIYFLTPVRGLDSIIQKVMAKSNGTKDEEVKKQEIIEIVKDDPKS